MPESRNSDFYGHVYAAEFEGVGVKIGQGVGHAADGGVEDGDGVGREQVEVVEVDRVEAAAGLVERERHG